MESSTWEKIISNLDNFIDQHQARHMIENHVIKDFMQTFDTVSAGDHWDRRMSRHMAPLLGKVKSK